MIVSTINLCYRSNDLVVMFCVTIVLFVVSESCNVACWEIVGRV